MTRVDVRSDGGRFAAACAELSQTASGLTAAEVDRLLSPQVPGWRLRGDGSVELSWWDLFVLWHYVTMQLTTAGAGSNRAHGGPVFLPWHRLFMIRLEQVLQQVTGDDDLALPWWDWAADGERPVDEQHLGELWSPDHLGPSRGEVDAGPLAALRVRLTQGFAPAVGMFLEAHAPRRIRREAGADPRFGGLPTKADVEAALDAEDYDLGPWDVNAGGFRNLAEGWRRDPPNMHNRVHVWVGGDMGPGTSPNDPVFYLNHCNVDRIWEARRRAPGGLAYAPEASVAGAPAGHRLDDPLVALLGEAMTPAEVLDPTPWYDYDDLDVAG